MKNKILFVSGAILINSYLYASPFTVTLQNKGDNISYCTQGLYDKHGNLVNLPKSKDDPLKSRLTTEQSPYRCYGNADGVDGSLSVARIDSTAEKQDVLTHIISVKAKGQEELKQGSDVKLEWGGQRKYYCYSAEHCNLGVNSVVFTQQIEYKGAQQPTIKTIEVSFAGGN